MPVEFKNKNGVITEVSHNDPLPGITFAEEVALGKADDSQVWNKFGYNEDVDVGTEVVAAFGGSWSPIMTATTLDVVSSSTDDANSGTGAHGVVIYGVDENWENQIEVVMLNGTTTVTTTNSWMGVNRVSLFRAGSGLQNAGLLTITATTGGATQATVPVGEGTSQQLISHVPVGHTGLIEFVSVNAEKLSGGGNPKVTFKGWVFSAVANAKYEVFRKLIDTSAGNGTIQFVFPIPLVISEKSAMWLEATSDSANTSVNGRFSYIEVLNT